MQKSEFIAKIKTLAKKVYAQKADPLADPEDIEISKFPVIDQFPPLKKVMEDLFDFQYEPFVEAMEWVAPRPTTFRVKLVNDAEFYLIFQGEENGKGVFIAQVSGKKYFLESLPEQQQASEAIARLLRYNYASVAQTPSEGGLESGLEDSTPIEEPSPADEVPTVDEL